MKMWGVFPTVRCESDPDQREIKQSEAFRNPIGICRYSDHAQELMKKYKEGDVELLEIDLQKFDVITRISLGGL